MAITLDTRCVQHGLSGTDKTFQTLIDTCASPPPTPEKLSSWTDDYDGEACEIKYYSVRLTLNAEMVPFNSDFGIYRCSIFARTPDGQTLTEGPTDLQQLTSDISGSVRRIMLSNIPEGSTISIMTGNGWYTGDRGSAMIADVTLVNALTGESAGIFTLTEDTIIRATVIGSGSGDGGLLV